MSRQCFSSRSLTGRRGFSSGSGNVNGFRSGNSLSSTSYTGAGRSGGYSSISHYNFGRSRRLSGGGLGGFGGNSAGHSTGFRDFSSLSYGVGPLSYGVGLGRPGSFSSQSAGGYGRTGGFSSQSLGGYGSGYRCGGFSSRSLGGGYGRSYRMAGFGNESLGSGVCGGRGIGGGGLICGGLGYVPVGRFGESTGIHTVRVNTNLLRPLCIQIDPEISRVKEEEREQIKTLNDKFAGFIDKVRHLEQQNKVLECKWTCLQQQGRVEKKNMEPLFENYIATLKRQLDLLLNEREQLELEQAKFHDVVEEYKQRYEQEINRRMAAENEFVLLKKDVDCAYTSKVELEVKVEALRQELDFLRCVHETEIESLQTSSCDTSVIVCMDNSRELDMEGIISSVKCQYEEIAQKSKDEVNTLYENKYKELQSIWGRQCDNVCSCRHEIQELTRVIQRLKSDMENAKKQVDVLQTAIADNEQRGELALKDAKVKLADVENALHSSKDELARLLRDYQELLNTKIALDIEIAMYKSLLEGEESRISSSIPVNISVVGFPNVSSTAGPIYSTMVAGAGLGRKSVYGAGSGGQSYNQRTTSGSGKYSSRSGKLGYRTGYSSRSGGYVSKHSVSSGFGQSVSSGMGPCGSRDCGSVNVGCSSRSGSYSSGGPAISSGPCGGSCAGGGYTPGSTGGYAGEGYASGSGGCTTGDEGCSGSGGYGTGNACRAGYGGNCSIIR